MDEGKRPVDFALFAPYNEIVELIGDFSGWQPLAMTRGDDGWWRAEVDLADGDHLYKFRVKSLSYFAKGETLDVFDPYALQVTDDDDENSIVRVRGGKRVWTEYVWKHDDVPLPQNHELIVYELFVADFAGTTHKRGRFVRELHREPRPRSSDAPIGRQGPDVRRRGVRSRPDGPRALGDDSGHSHDLDGSGIRSGVREEPRAASLGLEPSRKRT